MIKPDLRAASRVAILFAVISGATAGVALADCESDMLQLEEALKKPDVRPEGKAALESATSKAVTAMKKDDDATCHKVIADALAKAGLPMK